MGDGDERAVVAVQEVLEPVNGFKIEVVGGLVEEQGFRLAKQGLRQQDADFLPALHLTHFALVEFLGNVEAIEEDSGVGLGGVAVLVADGAFELAKPHAVGVGEVGFVVDAVALFKSGPEAPVAHDDGVDDAVGVEGELILAEYAELARADDGTFLRVELAGEDLHEGGLAGAVGSGEAVAAAGDEADADVLEEHLRAVAHGYIADTEHCCSGSYMWAAVWNRLRRPDGGWVGLLMGRAHAGSAGELLLF